MRAHVIFSLLLVAAVGCKPRAQSDLTALELETKFIKQIAGEISEARRLAEDNLGKLKHQQNSNSFQPQHARVYQLTAAVYQDLETFKRRKPEFQGETVQVRDELVDQAINVSKEIAQALGMEAGTVPAPVQQPVQIQPPVQTNQGGQGGQPVQNLPDPFQVPQGVGPQTGGGGNGFQLADGEPWTPAWKDKWTRTYLQVTAKFGELTQTIKTFIVPPEQQALEDFVAGQTDGVPTLEEVAEAVKTKAKPSSTWQMTVYNYYDDQRSRYSVVSNKFTSQPDRSMNTVAVTDLFMRNAHLSQMLKSTLPKRGEYDSVYDHTEGVFNMFNILAPLYWSTIKEVVEQHQDLNFPVLFPVILALHDVGKAPGDATNQYQHITTAKIFDVVIPKLGLSQKQATFMREIVLHDKLGEVMKDGVDPAGAAREMDRKAKAVGMKVTHFYNLQELYYLSDSMSYQEIRQYFYFEWFENRKDYGRVQHLYRGRPSQRLERLRDAVAGYEPKPVAPPPPQTQEPEAEDATRDDTGGSNQNQAGQTQAQPQVQTQGNGQSGQTQGAPTQGAVSQGGIGAPSNTTPQPPPGLGAQQAPPKRIQLLRNAQIYQVSRGPGGEDQFHKVYIESDSQIYKINKIVTSDHGDYFEIIRFQNYYQVHKSQVKVID